MSAVPTLTTLGASIWIRGVLRGKEDLVLHGCIEGHLSLQGTLHVATRGLVRASIHARAVEIAGDVWGNIHATETVHVHATGRIFGDVHAPKITLATGAIVHGILHGANDSLASEQGATSIESALASPPSGRLPASLSLTGIEAVAAETARRTHGSEPEARTELDAEGEGTDSCSTSAPSWPASETAPRAGGLVSQRDAAQVDWVERPRMRPISLLPPKARKLPKKRRMSILVKRRGEP